jgi:hypothetical protein
MKSTLAILITLASVGSAIAQTTPGAQGPTQAQCKSGYKSSMPWSQAVFKKACADMGKKKKQM